MNSPPFDVAVAHRWFAVECNNQAWDILESGVKTPPQLEQALHLAHAALFHWAEVGTSLNRQRALDLLAHACRAAGRREQAATYAQEALELSKQNSDTQSPFDAAQALATMAATRLDRVEAQFWRTQAHAAAQSLDPDDRAVVLRWAEI